MILDRFPVCLPFTLAQECPFPTDWDNPKNYSDDRGDSGGPTKCGITHREYDLFRKRYGLPTQDVRKMTRDEGGVIYRTFFWEPYCDALPAGLDLEFFDSSVNEGTTEAVKILQVALGLVHDGDWGPKTDAAVRALHLSQMDTEAVVTKFTIRRDIVYRQTKHFALFGKDWERRSNEIGAEALKMAQAA